VSEHRKLEANSVLHGSCLTMRYEFDDTESFDTVSFNVEPQAKMGASRRCGNKSEGGGDVAVVLRELRHRSSRLRLNVKRPTQKPCRTLLAGSLRHWNCDPSIRYWQGARGDPDFPERYV